MNALGLFTSRERGSVGPVPYRLGTAVEYRGRRELVVLASDVLTHSYGDFPVARSRKMLMQSHAWLLAWNESCSSRSGSCLIMSTTASTPR